YQFIPLSGTEQDHALAGIHGLTGEDLDRLKRQLFRVVWLGETDAEADKVLAAQAKRPHLPGDADKAVDWLTSRLASAPLESLKAVEEGNRALGISKDLSWWRDTILKDRLQGKPKKKGFGPGAVW